MRRKRVISAALLASVFLGTFYAPIGKGTRYSEAAGVQDYNGEYTFNDYIEENAPEIITKQNEEDVLKGLYGNYKSVNKPHYQEFNDDFGNGTIRSFNIKDSSPVKYIAESVNNTSRNLTTTGYIEDVPVNLTTDVSAITDRLDEINDTIKKAQHKYRVAYLYSKNNEIPNTLWRPTLEEVPEVLPYIYWAKNYASVYEGYWNLGVNPNEEKSNIKTLGIKDTDENMDIINRATKILGNDIVLKYDVLTYKPEDLDNTSDYSYSQELIDKDEVTYSDAVQVLYKALGHKQVWSAISTKPDPSITPANSPLSKALSNVTSFDNSAGTCSVFVSRSGKIVERAYKKPMKLHVGKVNSLKSARLDNKWTYDTEFNDYYWEKALSDGIVYDGIYPYNDAENGARVFRVNYESVKKMRDKLKSKGVTEGAINTDDRYDVDKSGEFESLDELGVDKEGRESRAYMGQYGDSILGKDLIKITAELMHLYGEPVMSKQEEAALLQVYGAEYPIQLSKDYMDAWAYLKARGVLNVNLDLEEPVTMAQLLDIALCVGDKDSRTDFKKIVPTISLSNDLIKKGYYPNDKFKVSDESIETDISIDYSKSKYWDYLIPVDAEVRLSEDTYKQVFTENYKDAVGVKRHGEKYLTGAEMLDEFVPYVSFKERIFGPTTYGKMPEYLRADGADTSAIATLPENSKHKYNKTASESDNNGKVYTYSTTFRDWETNAKTNSFYVEGNWSKYKDSKGYLDKDKARGVVGLKINSNYQYKGEKNKFTPKLRWLAASYEGKIKDKAGQEYYHFIVSKDYDEFADGIQINTDDPDDVPSYIVLPKGGGVYTNFKVARSKNPGTPTKVTHRVAIGKTKKGKTKYKTVTSNGKYALEPFYPDEGRVYGSTFMYATKEGHYSFNKYNNGDWQYLVDAIRSEGYWADSKKDTSVYKKYKFDDSTKLETSFEENEDRIMEDIDQPTDDDSNNFEQTGFNFFDLFRTKAYAAKSTKKGKTTKKPKSSKANGTSVSNSQSATFSITSTTLNSSNGNKIDDKVFNPLITFAITGTTSGVPDVNSTDGRLIPGTGQKFKTGTSNKVIGTNGSTTTTAEVKVAEFDPWMDYLKNINNNTITGNKVNSGRKAFTSLVKALYESDFNKESIALAKSARHLINDGAIETLKTEFEKVATQLNVTSTKDKVVLSKFARIFGDLNAKGITDKKSIARAAEGFYDLAKESGYDFINIGVEPKDREIGSNRMHYDTITVANGNTSNLQSFIQRMNKVANKTQKNSQSSTSISSSGNTTDPGQASTDPSTDPIVPPTGISPNKQKNASIGTTAITSVIMNKSKNILVSWDSIVKAGIVPELEGGAQPEANALDGIFYLQTYKGIVKVNPESGTLMVGTTFYNFGSREEAGSPILVYTHKDKLYFDIRCFTGITKKDVIPNATGEIKISNTSTGIGVDSVYDLDIKNLYDIYEDDSKQESYLIPFGTSAKDNSLIKHYPLLTLLKKTKYDGQTFINQQIVDGEDRKKVYWSSYISHGGGTLSIKAAKKAFANSLRKTKDFGKAKQAALKASKNDVGAKAEYFDGKPNSYRISLNDFNPTANYVLVIDAKQSIPKSSLFVWYPRDSFTNTRGPGGGRQAVYDKYHWYDKPKIGVSISEEKKRLKSKAEKMLKTNFHDVSIIDSLPVYGKSYTQQISNNGYNVSDVKKEAKTVKGSFEAMTLEASAHLYDMTNGGVWLDDNYAIREFNVSNNSPVIVNTYSANSRKDDSNINGNANGSIYWLDGIGFVYNVPRDEIYNHREYLSGSTPLPITYDVNSNKFIDYNIDYIGYWNNVQSAWNNKLNGYGWVPISDRIVNVFDSWKNRKKIHNGEAGVGVENSKVFTDTTKIRYAIEPGRDKFVEAPMGAYIHMGGENYAYITGEDAMSAILSANTVYWGHFPVVPSKIGKGSVYRGNNFIDSFEPNSESRFYKIYNSKKGRDFYISVKSTGTTSASVGNKELKYEDGQTNDILEYFNNITLKGILDTIDAGASYIILIALFIIPGFMLIVMTILVGLSFITDAQIFQIFCEKVFDPIKILTLGFADVNTWHWRTVLLPCCLLWCSFALVLNGNIFRLVQWAVEWFLVVRELVKTTF